MASANRAVSLSEFQTLLDEAPTVLLAIIRQCAKVAAAITTLGLSAPMLPACADPDRHIPNGDANWCPAGDYRERISGGRRYCLGAEFADGTFYAQSWGHSPSPFGPGYWTSETHCSRWVGVQSRASFPVKVHIVAARWTSRIDTHFKIPGRR